MWASTSTRRNFPQVRQERGHHRNEAPPCALMQHVDVLPYCRDGMPVRATDSRVQTVFTPFAVHSAGGDAKLPANTKYKCIIRRTVESRVAETWWQKKNKNKKQSCNLALQSAFSVYTTKQATALFIAWKLSEQQKPGCIVVKYCSQKHVQPVSVSTL